VSSLILRCPSPCGLCWLTCASGRASAGSEGEVIEESRVRRPARPAIGLRQSRHLLSIGASLWLSGLMPELYREFGVGKCRAFSDVFLVLGAPGPVVRVRGHAACGLEPNSGSPPSGCLPSNPVEARGAPTPAPHGTRITQRRGTAERRTLRHRRRQFAGVGSPPALTRRPLLAVWPLYAARLGVVRCPARSVSRCVSG